MRHFTSLSQADRERVLLSWADSRVAQRRAAFQALRKGALLAYYGSGGANGDPNPAWDAIGYPGPLGPPQQAPPHTLTPVEIDADTTLECDVVIVGSGAGGGTAAGVLAQAGLDVVIVEAGGYYDQAEFDGAELRGFDRLYLNGGGMASADGSVGLLAGSALGGGTLVNYTFAFRPPDDLRREWAGEYGVAPVATKDFDQSLDAVWERIGVNAEHSVPSRRDESIRAGLEKLGWGWDVMQRNVRGCREEVCRLCHYGCQLGAKQSTLKTWIQDAHDAGARILVGTRADSVITEGGSARGIEARTADGHRVTVRARAVVSACGALHTPALLARSGVRSKELGKNLRLHPVMVIWGQFDEEIRPWEGMLASTYSDHDSDMDGKGYGVKYEHVAIPPSILLTLLALARWPRARRADAGTPLHRRARRAAARPRRRRGAHRPRRRAGRALQAHARRRRPPASRRARRRADPRGDGRSARVLVALALGGVRAGSARRPRQLRPGRRRLRLGRRARRRWSPSTSWAALAWAARPPIRSATPEARSGTRRACTSSTARPSRPPPA